MKGQASRRGVLLLMSFGFAIGFVCAPGRVHEAGLGLVINLVAALNAHVAIGRGGGVDDVKVDRFIGLSGLAAGGRQRTTARERCNGARA